MCDKMCLASEARKMDTVVSQPEDSCSLTSMQQTAVKAETQQQKEDTDKSPPSMHTAPVPSPPSLTSTSSDATPPLSSQNARVKKKTKKKEESKENDADEMACPAKIIKRLENHEKPEEDSISSTIEIVAKRAWEEPEDEVKSTDSSSNSGNHVLPKKKSKLKVKAYDKEQDVVMEEGPCGQQSSDADMKTEMTDVNLKTEAQETRIESTEIQDSIVEPYQSSSGPSSTQAKEEDKGKDILSEVESSTESRGSRKSERSCKGALYKTLVSEGMLTSLRANIDRGWHLDSTDEVTLFMYIAEENINGCLCIGLKVKEVPYVLLITMQIGLMRAGQFLRWDLITPRN